MDCYTTQNPSPGQKCNDSNLGPMVFDKDLGWLQDESGGYVQNGVSIFPGDFGTQALAPFKPGGSINTFLQNNSLLLLGIGVFIVALFLMKKKKK